MDRITVAISLKIISARWRAVGLFGAPLLALAPSWVAAGPAGGHIVGGSGSITRPNSNLTEIHQGSDRLAIDWQQFNVNANEVVKFVQPSSHSIALNRILDSKQSLILGRIEANGRIFLVNPRGIIFGKDATVNVAGLVASSLDIDPREFIHGNFEFTDKGGEGVIVNQGTIEAAVGGAVVLLGKVVINDGDIHTPQGSARLVSAGGAVISFDDNEQLGIQITAQQQQKIENQTDAVRNSGSISAPGGYIALTGATTADLFTNAVNNESVLVANSVSNRNGIIELTGSDGSIAQSGRIDVSAADGSNGGKIAISGNAIHETGKLSADGANGGTILLKTNGQLHAQDLILIENNAAISASGSNGKGGHIELLGDRVGVLDSSRIDASGSNGGGVVHVGGEFHGAGSRNAQRTVVDNGVSIYADATKKGNGGEVVLWSDDITYFSGNIFARGGANGGDGGNVEVSGKQSLSFSGFVDTSATHGKMGNLLLDPAIINIINGSGGAQDAGVADGIILSGDAPSPYQISEQALEALTSNVTLTATQQINIADLADNLLLFNPNGGTVTFNINGSGNTGFAMADVNDEIRVNNGNLVINSTNTGGAVSFTLGKLTTTAAGNITVNATATCTAGFFSSCSGGAITINGGTSTPSGAITSAGTVTINAVSTGDSYFGFFSSNSGGDVALNLGNIGSSSAVTVSASSAGSTGGLSFTPGSGNTTITLGNIIESGNANIQVTADSTYNTALETINVGGSYLTDGTGGNISFSGNTLNLTSNTLIENAVFAAGATITISDSTPTLNGHTLAQGYNNIYVGDVSGSATTFGDFGFSQANIDAFTSAPLVLRAKNNIFIGDTTVTSTGATAQLVANRDNTGGGDISLAGGNTLDANGRNLTLSGANASINGSIVNSGSGTQQITTTAAINMGSAATLTSGSGNISLNAGTGITMANNASITSTTGRLALTAGNNIALGTLTTSNATTSAVNVTSTAGAISDAGAPTNISAFAAGSRVALNAASGIALGLTIADLTLTNSSSGTVSLTTDRALQISSFTNTPATAASVTTVFGGSDLTIAGNVASGGNLTLTSSGAFTVNNGSTVNSNAGTLAINATGDAAITGLTTTNNTASAISVISGGAITDNGNTNLDISATQANAIVTLQAVNGIGAANALDLAITNLSLSNSTSGAVVLTNNRALQINSFTNTPATTVSVTTTGVGSNMTIAGNLSSGSNIALTSSGTFTVTNGFTVNPAAGTLSINSTGNAAITGLTTTNNTASAISVISGGAISDNGNTALDITATQPNAVVTLQAANGIGAANALDLAITNLSLSNSTSGAVALTNNRALQINLFTNTPATAASVTTTGGASNMTIAGNVASGSNLSLTSSGTFTINDGNTVNSNTGTLAINATGNAAITGLTTTNNTASAVSVISAGAITDNGDTNRDITATQANAVVTLQAANGIGAANQLDLTIANLILTNSTGGAVSLTNNRALQINSLSNTPATTTTIVTTGAGSNMTIAGNVASGSNLSLTSSGAFTVTDGFTLNPTAGTLSINSTGNAAITGLTTTNNTAGAISVISGGAISDSGDTNADITATQPSAVVTLQAASGIGTAANAIDINVTSITANNGTSGDIGLHALGSYTFSAIDNSASANGAVALSSDGNLTVNNVTTTNGAITLSAFDNVSLAAGAALQSSGGNVAITADTNTNGVGAINMGSGTINSGAGSITLSAAQDINLNQLTTTNATTSAVSITSTAGKILGNSDGTADITAISAGSRVTLHAATGIDAGGTNPLELSVLDLIATNSTSGGINLTNDRALQISGLTNTPVTTTTITTTGVGSNLTIAGNVASGSNLALTSSGTFTVNNGSTVNSNAGTLSIDATGNAAITGLTTTNNTASAISVISGGAISDNGNTSLDMTATQPNAVVILQAANGIGAANALDLAIANLNLTNSTSGAVALTNNRVLQINSLVNTPATTTSITTTGVGSNMSVAGNVASGSDIALTSSGTFSVTDGFTVNPTAGTLSINSTGNAAITGLTTTNNTASAISVISGGAISDNGNTNLDITATQANAVVTLQAANGIGVANALDLAIGNLSLTNSTSGAVSLTNNRTLQINSFTNTPATASSVTTTGSGSNMIIAGNVSSGSNLSLSSSGTLSVTDGFTVNSNAGTLSINAAGDAAITGLQSSNNTASAVSVISAGAISDNGDTNRDITATAANAVVILQAANGIGAANPLDLAIANLSLTNTISGAVALTNNRALQINSFTNVPITTASITTTGVGSTMIVAGNIASGSDIALTSSGTFSVVDGFTVNPTAGTLSINAAGNTAITGLTTTNNTANAISVISGGAISDAGDTNADITATQPSAITTLQAASGIGNGNAIDINGQIVAANGNSGDIRLHALGSYTFGAIDNSASTNGVVALNSDGNLTVNNVTTASGAINLSAVDDVLLATGAALQSTGGNVSITADTNSNGIGQIAMGSGTINSGNGTITLSAAQDINLNTLTTTNATTSAVLITSTAGKILGNFDGAADITAISAGSRVTLNAANGIDAGSNPLELSILDLIATNSTAGGINLTNNRTLQISGLTNTPATNTAIMATGVGSDLIFVSTLQNGGGNATLTATRNIDLQNVSNVAALSTNSAAVNYAQSVAAGSISSTGTATLAGNLTATTGNIDLQTVALGAGAHTFSTIGGNDINLGAITGTSNLQLSSARNITLASADLGAGNFSATGAANGIFTANGTISAAAVTLNQFSTANLLRIVAGNTLDVAANTINLSGDLLSAGAMTLTGTAQLQSDILLSETGSGGLLQLAGSVIGNAHLLTITAATNTVCIACTTGASAGGLAALNIQSSIKSVLGATSVNGNATINADQEIYLNGDTTITGNLALLADANNDGIGIAALLTGKQLSVSGTLTTQPIALSSIATPAQCAAPTGLPQMPSAPPPPPSSSPPGQPAFLTPNDLQIAIQESDKYGLAASDAMLRNVSQIAYLGNNCQVDSDTRKRRGQCDVDASMLDFLGTFLIDNQIPKNGHGQ